MREATIDIAIKRIIDLEKSLYRCYIIIALLILALIWGR